MITKRTLLLTLPIALLPTLPAMAQDDGLYPDPSSPNASFLRVIAPGTDSVMIDGTKMDLGPAGMTPYAEVEAGEISVTSDGEEMSFELNANTHYTVLATMEDQPLIEDGVTDSPAQADLLLYNLSDMDAFDLYATEAQTAALQDVAPGTHGSVGLKAPLTLTFELRHDGETLGALDPVDLRRGTATTIVVSADGTLASENSTYVN